MEDLTLALVTLTSFVLLFVVAIFADRVDTELDVPHDARKVKVAVPVDKPLAPPTDISRADVA